MPYRIKIPKESEPSPRDGQLLETVYHVVHVPTARRIFEDGRFRSGLIYDESRLRKSRMCVTWLSANTWALGSIYGNVQFAFRWTDHTRKRRCYWVEAMTGYRPHAYRILLTERDLLGLKHVREYDPKSDRGPLRLRNGNWYWNNQFTSEFMIEGELGLEDCTDFDFVRSSLKHLPPQRRLVLRLHTHTQQRRRSRDGLPVSASFRENLLSSK